MLGVVAVFLAVGCEDRAQSPSPRAASPEPREDRVLDPADKVGAADFDGDGVDEVVLFKDGLARWSEHAAQLGGEVQVVLRGDPDGDGHQVLLVGTGMGRTARTAPTRVWSLGGDGAELLFERTSERNQVADLDLVDGRLWAAMFGRGKAVDAGWIDPSGFTVVDTRNLATAWLPLDAERRVVGRIYGDAPKAPGDLRAVGPDGERVLPTLRGVRALTATDLDGDGDDDLLVGDGWHYAYGKQALARVRLLEGPDWDTGRTLAMFDGEYTAWSIEVVGRRLLATGTKAVHLLTLDALGWRDRTVAPVAETGNAVAFRDADGWWALVSGSPARLVSLD